MKYLTNEEEIEEYNRCSKESALCLAAILIAIIVAVILTTQLTALPEGYTIIDMYESLTLLTILSFGMFGIGVVAGGMFIKKLDLTTSRSEATIRILKEISPEFSKSFESPKYWKKETKDDDLESSEKG